MYFSAGVLTSMCLGIVIHADVSVRSEPFGQDDRVDQDMIKKLVRRIEGLEQKVEKQDEDYRKLMEASYHQEETNRKQEEINRKQAGVIEKLHLKLDTMEEELATLKSSNAFAGDTPEDSDDVDLPTKYARTRPSKRALAQPGGVAFTAFVDHGLSHLGIDSPLVFNRVLLNQGGAYNQYTGIFTCPVDGIYVFNFVVETASVQQIVAKLVVDNVNMVDGIADTFHPNQEAQGGNYATLSLRTGQSVWVANYRYADMGESSTDLYRFSTFSGHLVSPTTGGVLAVQG